MRTFLVVLVAALCACNDHASEPKAQAGQDRIYDAQRQALERAQQVNDSVMQSAEQRRAEEEAQSK